MRKRKRVPPLTEGELAFISSTNEKLIVTALGDEVAGEWLRLFARSDLLLRAPSTVRAAAEALAAKVPTVDESKIERLMESRLTTFNDIMRRGLETTWMLKTPAASQLIQFCRSVGPRGEGRLDEVFDRGIHAVLVPADQIPKMVLCPENLFEPTIKEAEEFVYKAIESWYKDLIAALVELTHAREGTTRTGPPQQALGGWMKEARVLWNRVGGPLAVLSDPLRLIRNEYAHEATQTRIDVVKETVRSPLDASATLTREQFAEFVHAVFVKLLGLLLALLASKDSWIPAPAGPVMSG